MRALRNRLSLCLISLGLMLGGVAVAQTVQPANAPQTPRVTTRNVQPRVVTDVNSILAKNATHWLGKMFTLKNVKVEDTNDTGNFWVGPNDDHRLLVVKKYTGPIVDIKVHTGAIVTVTGTIEPASKFEATASSASQDSMGDARDSSGVFLLADKMTITNAQH